MARRLKADWAQRQELHHILHWCRLPTTTPMQWMVKMAVQDFLNGTDPFIRLDGYKVERFTSTRAVEKARVFLGNERAKRRMRAKEILEARQIKTKTFTSGNLRVTIDNHQDRNYGAMNVSIYCIVEVWEPDNDLDAEKEYLVNFSDHQTKEWLTRLMVWALTNTREVLIKPATEAEMSSMRMFVPREKERVA